MQDYALTTERLGLRNWADSDLQPFSEMCADERVMEFFPNTLSKDQTNLLFIKMQNHFNEYGYCYFAVDRLDTNEFIGFIGLLNQTYKSEFTPCIDLGLEALSKGMGKWLCYRRS